MERIDGGDGTLQGLVSCKTKINPKSRVYTIGRV